MTKDEFLDEFIRKAGLPRHARTPDGVKLGTFHRIAVPCTCYSGTYDHEGRWTACPGWQLIEPPNTTKYRGGEYSVTRHV